MLAERRVRLGHLLRRRSRHQRRRLSARSRRSCASSTPSLPSTPRSLRATPPARSRPATATAPTTATCAGGARHLLASRAQVAGGLRQRPHDGAHDVRDHSHHQELEHRQGREDGGASSLVAACRFIDRPSSALAASRRSCPGSPAPCCQAAATGIWAAASEALKATDRRAISMHFASNSFMAATAWLARLLTSSSRVLF